ncbi:MAG: YitT family protein [Lachnospiraceae bacterium]|nr:YitT family protein [Lachnospiraceae bacterium]
MKDNSIYHLIKNQLKELKWFHFILLTIAGSINAFGVTIFLYPVKLYDSGVSGVSMLLDQVTPPYLTISLFLLVINIPIFLFGLKKQGFSFTVYSVYSVAIYSLGSYLIMYVLPIDVNFVSPLAGSDLLLCAIFGGVISGIGSGLTIRHGGAIDGIDVLSVIFAKRLGLSIGSFVMLFNLALYIVCGIILNSWILPLYSIITYFVASKTIDFIVDGFDRSKCAMIVTKKANEITEALKDSFEASGTIVDAVGGYSKSEFQIIYLIINHFQVNKLKTIVHSIDAQAFVSLHEISDVIRQQENV